MPSVSEPPVAPDLGAAASMSQGLATALRPFWTPSTASHRASAHQLDTPRSGLPDFMRRLASLPPSKAVGTQFLAVRLPSAEADAASVQAFAHAVRQASIEINRRIAIAVCDDGDGSTDAARASAANLAAPWPLAPKALPCGCATLSVVTPQQEPAAGDETWSGDPKHPPPIAGGTRLCQDLVIGDAPNGIDDLAVLHRCDHALVAVPRVEAAALAALLAEPGVATEIHADEPRQEAARALHQALAHHGLCHVAPAAAARLTETLSRARAEIPAYLQVATPALREFPIAGREHRRAHPEAFRSSRHSLAELRDRSRFRAAGSSTPGNRGHTSFLEWDAFEARLHARRLIEDIPRIHRELSISRPENFGLAAPAPGRCAWRETGRVTTGGLGRTLQITPGANPTDVADAAWEELARHAHTLAPDFIDGDPAYLAAFGAYVERRGLTLPSLRSVETSRSYAWRHYRTIIARALGVPVRQKVNASETWDTAAECRLGRLHLLETSIEFEILLDGGRPARPGETGLLVLSTRDAMAAPLIRYDTGDLVRLEANACACGRPFRVVSFVGRTKHLLWGRHDEPVTYLDLDAALGDVAGLLFFRLEVAGMTATWSGVPQRPGAPLDLGRVEAALTRLLPRYGIRCQQRDAIAVPSGHKFEAIETDASAQPWEDRLLGR